MFILQVAINERKIVQIHVINTGHVNEQGEHLYRIRMPEELNSYEIYHERKKPWYYLVEKIVSVLKEAESDKK